MKSDVRDTDIWVRSDGDKKRSEFIEKILWGYPGLFQYSTQCPDRKFAVQRDHAPNPGFRHLLQYDMTPLLPGLHKSEALQRANNDLA